MTITGQDVQIQSEKLSPIPVPEGYTNPVINAVSMDQLSPTRYCLVFDPAHGSDCPGKCSPDKRIYEWSYTREIIDYLATACRAVGFNCIKLVGNEEDIVLRERINTLNKGIGLGRSSIALVISIHLNLSAPEGEWGDASGWTVWIPETTPSPFTSGRGEWQRNLARMFANGMLREAQYYKIAKYDKVLEHDFDMLHWSEFPTIMTGNMFMDNKQDVEFLLSAEGKRKIVQIHLNGILSALGSPVKLDYEKYLSGWDEGKYGPDENLDRAMLDTVYERNITMPFTLDCLGLDKITGETEDEQQNNNG